MKEIKKWCVCGGGRYAVHRDRLDWMGRGVQSHAVGCTGRRALPRASLASLPPLFQDREDPGWQRLI